MGALHSHEQQHHGHGKLAHTQLRYIYISKLRKATNYLVIFPFIVRIFFEQMFRRILIGCCQVNNISEVPLEMLKRSC